MDALNSAAVNVHGRQPSEGGTATIEKKMVNPFRHNARSEECSRSCFSR